MISASSLKIAGLIILFRIILDVWYIQVIPSLFVHYPTLSFSNYRFIESILFTVISIFLLPKIWRKPSEFYLSVLILGVFLPMCVIYAYADMARAYMYMVMFTLLVLSSIIKMPLFRFPYIKWLSLAIFIGMISIIAVVMVWLILKGARLTFDFSLIYEERARLNESISGIWGYLISWVGKIFIPILLVIAIYRKSIIGVIIVLCLLVIYFGLTTHKLFLVVGISPLFIYLFWISKNPVSLALKLIIILLLFAAGLYLVTGDPWVPALAVQRPIFKPALLNFIYVEYFADKERVLLSNGILGWLIKYPFDLNPPFLIGEYFKGNPETRSNTGFLGTGYAHFGLIGPLIFGFLVGFVLKVLDSVAKGLPVWFSIAATFGPFVSMMVAADFFAALNTHGVILSLMILWAVGNHYKERDISRL